MANETETLTGGPDQAPGAPAMETAEQGEQQEQMCCDGSGRTAEQHRNESPDHKCCVDG
jgi:hypothetical protein